MGDGHESEGAVERLVARWRNRAYELRAMALNHDHHFIATAIELETRAIELQAALREDRAIPERMK